jgi:hypothetical protein
VTSRATEQPTEAISQRLRRTAREVSIPSLGHNVVYGRGSRAVPLALALR